MVLAAKPNRPRKHDRQASASDLRPPTQQKSRSKSPSAKATAANLKRPESLTGLSKLPRGEVAAKQQLTPTSSTASLAEPTDFSDPHAFRALPGYKWERNAYGLIDCFADCANRSYGYGGFKKRRNFLVHLRMIHGQDVGTHDRRGGRDKRWQGRQMSLMEEMAEGSRLDMAGHGGDESDYGMESDGLLSPPKLWDWKDYSVRVETDEYPSQNAGREAVLGQDAPDYIDISVEMEYSDWPEDDDIQFDPYHPTQFDMFGVWLERKMGTPLDWWPLRPPVHPHPSGLTRMSWKCKCGSILSSVISNDAAKRYQRSHSPYGGGGAGSRGPTKPGLPQPPAQLSTLPPYLAGPLSDTRVPIKPAPNGTTKAHQVPTQPPIQPPAARIASQATVPPSRRDTLSSMSSSRRDTLSSVSPLVEKSGSRISPYILCCIRKGWYKTVLVHLRSTTFTTDQEFFRSLRAEYKRVRGWRYWCSLSVVVQIRFIRFTQYYLDFVDCHEAGVLPPAGNPDYEYVPKPPSNPPTLPDAELLHYFESPQCAGTATHCVALVPKRVAGPLELGARAEGWGLMPREGLSLWRLLALLAAVWLATMAFAAWWFVHGHGDVQGALAPAGYVVAVVAVGVVLPEMRVVWLK